MNSGDAKFTTLCILMPWLSRSERSCHISFNVLSTPAFLSFDLQLELDQFEL